MWLFRCIDFRYQRGGNASNNCTVLSQLDYPCEFLGILNKEKFSQYLQDDMQKNKIDFSHCRVMEDGQDCPTSIVILSAESASRTIIHHHNNQDELNIQDFEKLNLEEYSWVHFEVKF